MLVLTETVVLATGVLVWQDVRGAAFNIDLTNEAASLV